MDDAHVSDPLVGHLLQELEVIRRRVAPDGADLHFAATRTATAGTVARLAVIARLTATVLADHRAALERDPYADGMLTYRLHQLVRAVCDEARDRAWSGEVDRHDVEDLARAVLDNGTITLREPGRDATKRTREALLALSCTFPGTVPDLIVDRIRRCTEAEQDPRVEEALRHVLELAREQSPSVRAEPPPARPD